MSNDYIAVPNDLAMKYYKAKRDREDTFKKPFPTHDELAKAHQTMVDAAVAIAEHTVT